MHQYVTECTPLGTGLHPPGQIVHTHKSFDTHSCASCISLCVTFISIYTKGNDDDFYG